MQNYIKKTLVMLPVIMFLCISFIGVNVKADDKVNVANTTNQTENTTDKTNGTKDAAAAETNNGANKTNTSGTNTSNTSDNSKDTSKSKEGTATTETLPEWRNIDGKLHYVTKDGIVEKKGWFKEKDENPKANNDNEYYLDENSAATIGWKKIDGVWYYFDQAGIKQTGWKLINYNFYHLNKDGAMETGWIKDGQKKFYLNNEGIMSIGKKYIDDKWYYFGTDGVLQTGFYSHDAKLFYSSNEGVMVANEWIKPNHDKYYVKADSSLATGKTIIDNVMEEFDMQGKYIGSTQMEDHLFVKHLSVGDADCAFIKLPNGETTLIDTGTNKTSDQLVSFLKGQDLKQEDGKGVIDNIIITHGHSDHIGGLPAVLNNFNVKKVYMPDDAKMKDWYSKVKPTAENASDIEMLKNDYNVYMDAVKAMKKNKIKFTDTKKGEYIDKDKILEFVQSDKDFGVIGSDKITENYWGINENSAIVYLNYGDYKELFTADMEWNSEADFRENNLLDGKTIDVLKVPHHGHSTSSTSDFIAYLKPVVGVISRAKESIEKNEAYNNLTNNGVSIYETSTKDGISIYATTENWTMGSAA